MYCMAFFKQIWKEKRCSDLVSVTKSYKKMRFSRGTGRKKRELPYELILLCFCKIRLGSAVTMAAYNIL